MKRFIALVFTLVFVANGFSQHFFDNKFDKQKHYIILTNPTIRNIKTIQYLTKNHLLTIDFNSYNFVGVYYKNQNYDFGKTKNYIETNKVSGFYLQEISGELSENSLYKENSISAQLKKVFDNSVGVFFFGGPDIPPALYGEKNTKSVVTDPERHYFEASFLFHLLGGYQNETTTPFLNENPYYMVTGFCLGMQTINVATGGTLIQDIPQEIYGAETPQETVKICRENLHRNYWQKIANDSLFMSANFHTIQFTKNPFFTEKVKIPKRWNPRVYSSHHQAIEKLGKGLEVTALSADGKIIEGVVHKKFPHVFAVQFHPEVSALYEDMFVRKFAPTDKPATYHNIIGKRSIKFHKKYWEYISTILNNSKN